MKFEVSIVGPCFHDDSLGFDFNTREITVDVHLRRDNGLHIAEEYEYLLSQHSNKYGPGRWSEPFTLVEARIYGRSSDMAELERKAKMLKRLFDYARKLPVQPRTLAEWVATIAALHRQSMAVGTLMAYKDHKTRPQIVNEAATVAHMCHEVSSREHDLAPKEEAA